MASATAQLSSTHRYAAGGLFALALSQAQVHQHSEVGFGFPPVIDPPEEGASSVSKSDGVLPWSHENSGLLRHVFRSLISSSIDVEYYFKLFWRRFVLTLN